MKNKIDKVKKRDGTIADFDPSKIEKVIFKALTATNQGDGKKSKKISEEIIKIINRRFKGEEIPQVEQIQDIVEEILILEGLPETAKAYILYREQRRRIREAVAVSDESIEKVDSYLKEMDWQVQENANMTFSLQGLNQYVGAYISKKYWLNKIYPEEIRKVAADEDLHIHNLDTLAPYTFFGEEVVIVKFKEKIRLLSLKNLYEDFFQEEKLLNEKDGAWAKYPEDLYILDKEGWTRVSRMVRKKKEREMRFIKSEQGRSVIVTDNHPFIVKGKEVEAKDVKEKVEEVFSGDTSSLLKNENLFSRKHIYLAEELIGKGHQDFFLEGFEWQDFVENWEGSLDVKGTLSTSNSANSLNNKLELTEDLGYLVGIFIAEGHYNNWRLEIMVSDKKIIEKIRKICANLGVRSYLRKHGEKTERVSINSSTLKLVFEKVFQIKKLSRNKNIPLEILTYNVDFAKGVVGGIIDGDGAVDPENKSNNSSQVLIRVSSRTLVEQLALLLQFFGIVSRDRISTEDIGKINKFNGKEIVQNYPIYGIVFSKREKVSFPSFKYQKALSAKKKWRAENYGWNKVLNNSSTTINDEFIFDITTDSGTFLCNGLLVHNCMGWDLYDFLLKGFSGVRGKLECRPPKHLRTALGQLVNFLYTVQGEAAGAEAVSNFDTLLAPFIRYDNLNYRQVKQAMQEFLYNCMVPTRVGFQTPFINVSLDIKSPSFLAKQPVIIGGEAQEETYGDFQPEMDMFIRAFYEGLMEGDAKGRPFSVDGDCLCPVKNPDKIKLVKISDYIDGLMKKRPPFFVKENNCQVLDVRDLNIKSLGLKNGKIDWQKINFLVRHPITDPLFKISTVGGFNIKVTSSHSVLVLKDGKIKSFEAKKLQEGDYLTTPKTIPQGENKVSKISLSEEFVKNGKENGIYIKNVFKDKSLYQEKRTRQCNNSSYETSVFPLGNIKEQLNEFDLSDANLSLSGSTISIANHFPVTKELMEFLGWYCAEGSAEKNKKHGGISLGLNLSKEKKQAYHIAKLVKTIFPEVPVKIREIKKRNLIEVRIHSKLVRRIITEVFDVGNGRKKKVPQVIFELSPKMKKIFLKAYFKGDAWITKDIIVTSISRELVYGVSTLLKQLNVFYTLNEYTWKKRKRWRINIWQNTKLSVKDSGFISKIPIKESGLEELVETILKKKPYFHDSLGRKYKNSKNRIFQKFNISHQSSTSLKKVKKIIKFAQKLKIEIPLALREIEKNSISFLKIKKIEKVPSSNGMVYDFSTESENFIADQLLVHNTFPIPTVSITKDFDWKNPVLEPMWEATAKYGINYFSNFIKSDMSPEDARSMCPLAGDEKVLIRSSRGRKVEYGTIRNIFESENKKEEYEVYSNGKFIKGNFNKFENQKMLKVILENGHEIKISEEHLNFVRKDKKEKVLKGKELEKGMYLPYSLKEYKGEGGNEELGFFVGAYAGDGSFDGDTTVVFSLENNFKKGLIEKIEKISLKYFGSHSVVKEDKKSKLVTLKIHSRAAVGLCRDFVEGIKREKRYKSKLFVSSKEFREGVVKGHYATDGGNRNRIYTSSLKMVETLNMLASTLGTTTSIYKDERPGRLGKEPNYAVLFYQLNRKKYGDVWFKVKDKLWVKIKEIKRIKNRTAYCFEVKNGKKEFTVGTTGILTHNCRLRLDNRELYKRGGGLFGSAPLTGSIGVVTINLPRIGYLAKTKKDFFKKLRHLMDLSKESLEIKRKALEDFMSKDLYPFSKHYLSSVKKMRNVYFGNHFSTIGLMGMNEACLNFLGSDIASKKGKNFALEVLDFMRKVLIEYQENTGNMYNLEATPGEGTSYRQARTDKEKYPDIITSGTEEVPYYTNSTHLPVGYTDDAFEALEHQDELQTKYTGGCVEKGNKVLTNKGLLNIEEIVKNFEKLKPIKALSYNKEKEISEWDQIEKAVKINVKKHDKIKVKGERNLDIVTSDWHPFFVLKKFKPNPACPICKEETGNIKGFANHIRWNPDCGEKYKDFPKYKVIEKRADELKKGDYILQNCFNSYPEKETKLNSDLAWLIGFFVGDGSISGMIDNRGGNNIKKHKIRFFSEHGSALDKVAKILNESFDTEVKVIKNNKRSPKLKEVSVSKKEVIDFFFKYGFWEGEKCYSIFIPDLVKKDLNKNNVFSFLSGLMDSDGHLDKKQGDFEYYTVSEKLADDLLEICSLAGIMISKTRKKTKRKNEVDIWRLRIPSHGMIKIKDKLTNSFNLSRIKDSFSNRKKRYLPVVRVKEASKTEVDDEQFYDLMTRKNHNYLAGKNTLVFIHNTVLHLFLGERISSPEAAKSLVKKACEKFHLPYITLTPTFSICPSHGYLSGEHFTCPKCIVEQPCEVYSRVVGYIRPVQQWNKGKTQEYEERKEYKQSSKK